MANRKRPLAVSIIGWYLIVASALTVVTLPFTLKSEEATKVFARLGTSQTILIVTSVLGSLVCLVSGLAMLRRIAWGRTLWYVYGAVSAVYTLWLYRGYMLSCTIIPVIMLGVTWYFLSRQQVNAYFAGEEWQTPEESQGISAMPAGPVRPARALWMKIVGVILLVFAGFFLYMLMIFAASVPAGQVEKSLPSLALFAALFAGFAGAGMFLWGYWRWKILSGILLVSAGGIMLLIGFVLMQSEALTNGAPKVDPVAMSLMGKKALLVGLPAVAGGIWLIFRQRAEDKKA